MSTNKTQNYGLHAWEPGDDFLREEFNENFAALDAAVFVADVVVGTYTGTMQPGYTAVEQDIELGFKPRAVITRSLNGTGGTGFVTTGSEDYDLVLTDTGFRVRRGLNFKNSSNNTYNPYRYLAWR